MAELPLTLTSAQLGNQNNSYLRVFINDDLNCCADTEWTPPNCGEEELCEIFNLTIDPAACNGDNTYKLFVNFDIVNASNDFFDVFLRNNEYFATYAIADLPIVIQNFPLSGSAEDYIKVSMNDDPTKSCFAETKWPAPDCGNPSECDCPDEYDPVCVFTGSDSITYFNACYAECDGFSDNEIDSCPGECEDCLNSPYDPICVEVDGAILTMYNECFLFCNGFTPNNIVDCE